MESVWADISLRIYDKDYIVFTSPWQNMMLRCYDGTMTKTLHYKIYGLEMIAVVSIYLWLYWLWTFHDLDVELYVVIYDADSVEPHHDHQFLICSRNSLIIFIAKHVFVSAMCKHFSQLAKHPNFVDFAFLLWWNLKMLKC